MFVSLGGFLVTSCAERAREGGMVNPNGVNKRLG